MKRLLVFLLSVALVPVCACSSAKPKPTAESKAVYAGMKLGRPSAVKGAVEGSNVFLTSDRQIVALAEINDLRSEVAVGWEWVTPEGEPYLTVSHRVGPGEGMYYPKVAVSHALNVDREEASRHPGAWNVSVFIDGRLKESRKFDVEPGLATLLSPLSPPDPEKWALVVGLERYSHLPAVEYAGSDAETAANYFTNLLGVPEKNVILLENEKATRSAVVARLKDYLPANLDGDATLYVYFAGHGMPDVATGEPYLAFYDSEATNIARTGYRLRELLADVGALKVKNAFVFTDACFSGMAARGDKMLVPGARPALIRVDDVSLASGKVVAIGASTGSQLSLAYHDKRHGLFTYYLLAGLAGQADAGGSGVVTFGSLYAYLKENVERVSRRTTMEQVPSITPKIENVADVRLVVLPKQSKQGGLP